MMKPPVKKENSEIREKTIYLRKLVSKPIFKSKLAEEFEIYDYQTFKRLLDKFDYQLPDQSRLIPTKIIKEVIYRLGNPYEFPSGIKKKDLAKLYGYKSTKQFINQLLVLGYQLPKDLSILPPCIIKKVVDVMDEPPEGWGRFLSIKTKN